MTSNVNPTLPVTFFPNTKIPITKPFGQEVSMFLHCHLRRYDRVGEGIHPDEEHFDQYGAPIEKPNSWEEGYHCVEKKLGYHDNFVEKNLLSFPLAAGMGGAVHLYKSKHDAEPWNWTGWIPQQNRWLSQGKFFSNRYFLGLRGNEIQNNLWDYDPYGEEEEEEEPGEHDLLLSLSDPTDKYRGGYWFHNKPFGRYLHIIALKSHYEYEVVSNTESVDSFWNRVLSYLNPFYTTPRAVEGQQSSKYPRYNYIVHPLAYRSSINTLPDNSVDAMQWSIINMPNEGHFGEGKPWGEKCHGLEIFNDFTYFYSYQKLDNDEDSPYNSELCWLGTYSFYFWFDTYPMEFAVFLLDSALARGVYYHTICANDAFYERTTEPNDVLLADPKGCLLKYNMKYRNPSDARLGVRTYTDQLPELEKDAIALPLKSRPYGSYTAFGYVKLLDPLLKIKNAVFQERRGVPRMGLNGGEKLAMEFLRNGNYYSTTGFDVILKYEVNGSSPPLPYKISGQPNDEMLCYDLTEDMELKFTFLKCTDAMATLIWRYTIMFETSDNLVVPRATSYGYFKLDPNYHTILDLRNSYTLSKVKWLYFTAISPTNPQHRAWFHAIRGPAFGVPDFNPTFPTMELNVVVTTRNNNTVTEDKRIEPTSVDKGELDFIFETPSNQRYIYVYLMQVCALQQDFSEPMNWKENIKESSRDIPPRYLQSVHGYFICKKDHLTRIHLAASWDKNTVKDDKIHFYRIDVVSGKPESLASTPVRFHR